MPIENNLEEIFNTFSNNFRNRIESHPIENITEDCLRYDLFAAFFKKFPETASYILEYPHPGEEFKGRELDFVFLEDGIPSTILEMKYFKRLPSDKQDRTGYMAKLCVDLLKLHFCELETVQKFFVFATDDAMQIYMNNERNGFSTLLKSKIRTDIDFHCGMKSGKLDHFTKTIYKDIAASLAPMEKTFTISRSFEYKIPNNHMIYIFKVE